MKYLKYLCIMLLMAMVVSLGACASGNVKLSAPQDFEVKDDVLYWSPVENATGYDVFVQNQEHFTQECSFDLSILNGIDECVIEVMALGDGEKYDDSEWSSYTYKKEIIVPTEGLEYRRCQDGSGYEVSRGKAKLDGEIIFPDEYDGQAVTKIADEAFYYEAFNKDLETGYGYNKVTTRVRLPKYLEEIGESAFDGCIALEEVVIPKSVKVIGKKAFCLDVKLEKIEFKPGSDLKTIGEAAFLNCNVLKGVDIPESVEEIGMEAFYGCDLLTEIKIPEKVKRLEAGVFKNCTALKEVIFPSEIEYVGSNPLLNTQWYADRPEGFVALFGHVIGFKGKNIPAEWPEDIKHVSDEAFANGDIESAIFPSGVSLGEELFYWCKTIKSVILPDDLTELPDRMFHSCTALKTVKLPSTLTKIGDGCFFNSGIETLDIPEGVKEIGDEAFRSSRKLNEITIPEGVEKVGWHAFDDCELISAVTIPSTLKIVGDGAFVGLDSLKKVKFNEGCTEVFDRMFNFLNLLEKVELPSSLETIGANAFKYTGLKSIEIPAGVKKIGEAAFSYTSLFKIAIPDSVTEVGEDLFKNSLLTEIVIPVSMTKDFTWMQGAKNLTKLYFKGTQEEWDGILPSGASFPENVQVIYIGHTDSSSTVQCGIYNGKSIDYYLYKNKKGAV